jgi:beta-1,4-N-acetylglucosaminyltransferase
MPSKGTVERRLLVTVGTTRFDALIEVIFGEPVVEALRASGYTQWRVQHGASPLPNPMPSSVHVEAFPYRPDLRGDFEWADLVVGHAGAGTVLDVLRGEKGKRLIVVTNDLLMDGHQSELATQLSAMGICQAASPK